MVRTAIELCRDQGVALIVAPYEADAQLAYHARAEHVDCVLGEDSDLFAYECPKVRWLL